MGKTAIVLDKRYIFHEMGNSHPESPGRLLAIREVLDGDGIGREVVKIEPREAVNEELAWVHDENYIKRIAATAGREFTSLDPDTSANAHTWEAAVYAAGGFLQCVEEVCKGHYRNAFAFVRPPGHHAERARAMGFCFFNNIAIGAEWLMKNCGLERIAIVDFDVHHCNGTQHTFYRRPDVFVASVHRFPFYPGSGGANETGEGEGKGATLNVPLHAGAGDDDYRRAFEEKIIPALDRFGPRYLLVSAGFDAHVLDPLGGMKVSTAGFKWMMETLTAFARERCNRKMAVTLEGGYNLKALRGSAEASLEAMAGV